MILLLFIGYWLSYTFFDSKIVLSEEPFELPNIQFISVVKLVIQQPVTNNNGSRRLSETTLGPKKKNADNPMKPAVVIEPIMI
ncbi:MAG: hypothetical protein BBJ57_02140 [Desulfobacterales bacterium PC51MH44]|nr:MAG: hypothetical protein BBJ57_02140 [Desulfobacterales bacterium PC51MH44]